MHKATPSAHRSLRHIAEEKNAAAGFEQPPDYDAQGGTPRGAKDVSQGEYRCNVQGTITQTPRPSRSVKDPIK